MEEAEVNGDRVHFCTDSQCISLHLQGMGSETVAPAAPKRRRWVEVTLAFVMGTMVSCFVALLVVALWPRADPSFQKFHAMADNVTSWPSLVEPDNSFHFGRVAEEQEVIQMFKDHVENSKSWPVEIQWLKYRMDNVSSQIQMLSGHQTNTSADLQRVNGVLEDIGIWSTQTQMLRSSLEEANAEIQDLKGALEKIQTLESSLQKASAEIQKLKHDLENIETLSAKVPEQQSSVEALRTAFASWEQLQKTQNQLLQLILQGWKVFSGSLYYFSDAKKSWNEAEQFCVSQGAHLASVTSEEEQTFLTKSTSTSHHWIGLTDTGTEGFWHWVDGTPFSSARSRRFWGRNQPDNWRHENGHTEDCVHIQQMWNDMYCDAAYQWVCKKPVGQDVA
ncbi:C-type lectin domain family 4 member F isoform X2 [Choloepus didactylus]|uniref:C-type lectin domain family 4 member F isoform X2 n=1 Tax=Choloepus didactylus TaxID=27675 RepID=UPI00189ECF21|nr:C-type lectin domain family 4 member F isoform X2 [Choloepus didactylus]